MRLLTWRPLVTQTRPRDARRSRWGRGEGWFADAQEEVGRGGGHHSGPVPEPAPPPLASQQRIHNRRRNGHRVGGQCRGMGKGTSLSLMIMPDKAQPAWPRDRAGGRLCVLIGTRRRAHWPSAPADQDVVDMVHSSGQSGPSVRLRAEPLALASAVQPTGPACHEGSGPTPVLPIQVGILTQRKLVPGWKRRERRGLRWKLSCQ